MFAYSDAHPDRPSFEALLDTYFELLPEYQGEDLENLTFKRILFGGFPCYSNGPLQPAFDRVMQVRAPCVLAIRCLRLWRACVRARRCLACLLGVRSGAGPCQASLSHATDPHLPPPPLTPSQTLHGRSATPAPASRRCRSAASAA